MFNTIPATEAILLCVLLVVLEALNIAVMIKVVDFIALKNKKINTKRGADNA